MSTVIPRTTSRELHFEHGDAIGMSHRWEKGQCCSILTAAGIVGCGIYDLKTPAEFDQAIAIAKGTPACPLVEPEDLFDARIVGVTPKAAAFGVKIGMTGREAVELMLRAEECGRLAPRGDATRSVATTLQVKSIDHVTLVVKDLARSRRFYVDVLGMREVPRPAFSFAGSWFQAGKTQIHLILEYAGSGPAGNLLAEDRRGPRTQHLAFEVDDASAAHQDLVRLGVWVLAPPKLRPDGYMQLFVTDPDGHVVELCSPPLAASRAETPK